MLSDGDKIRLKEINKYWYDRNVEGAILRSMPAELESFINLNMASAMFTRFWPAGCLTSNFHDWVFPRGLRGILNEIHQYRKRLNVHDPDSQTKIDFYEAAEITINAVIAFAHRFAELAKIHAENSNGKLKDDYMRIADICNHVPEFPPASFHEALQCFYFCHLITSQIEYFSDGLGQRFDKIFYPFYKADKQRGSITYDRAVELFEFLFIKLDDLGQLNPITTAIYQAGGTKFQAVLKSCSKVNPLRSWNQLLNQKIHPSFAKGKNKKIFADYLRTWHSFNNWHIQINCHNVEDLKEAIKYPEKHRDLIVRVAGYSAYFTELASGLQNDIIKRTEQYLHR